MQKPVLCNQNPGFTVVSSTGNWLRGENGFIESSTLNLTRQTEVMMIAFQAGSRTLFNARAGNQQVFCGDFFHFPICNKHCQTIVYNTDI